MKYVWLDYNPETMSFVEAWLDECAVESTGLDGGFRCYYDYWSNEDGFVAGENFWCKIVFENDKPFAIIVFCRHEDKLIIMEVLIAPERRNQGKGTTLLKEFLHNDEITGFLAQEYEAVIYPDNIASQKAFENAGFTYQYHHHDENGDSMRYVYRKTS